MARYERFILAPTESCPGNEYRILRDRVEFRSFRRNATGRWRALEHADILLHLNLETPVARWLLERLQQKTNRLFTLELVAK